MFSNFEFVIIVFALTFSAFIKGSLGLGFSTISLAILANFIDLKVAIALTIIPSLFSNLMIMMSVGEFKLSLKSFWPMFLATVIGVPMGLYALFYTDSFISKALLGLILIIYGTWGLFNINFRLRKQVMPTLSPIIGLLTGVFNGATGSQIFPVMPYLLSLPISRNLMLQTINLSFTLCSIIILSALWQHDSIDLSRAAWFSLGVIPVALGIWLGSKLRKHLPEQRYRQAVMIFIMVLGISLLQGIIT